MPYVFFDATYCKARVAGRVVSRRVVGATGVSADGRREVLGLDVGDSESEDFWTEFLLGLRDRGLHGVQLVISDAHRGLTNAIGAVFAGAAWRRCRVHFMRGMHLPRRTALLRLASCVLIETHDGWQVSDRYVSEASMAQLTPPAPTAVEPRRDTAEEVNRHRRPQDGMVSTNSQSNMRMSDTTPRGAPGHCGVSAQR